MHHHQSNSILLLLVCYTICQVGLELIQPSLEEVELGRWGFPRALLVLVVEIVAILSSTVTFEPVETIERLLWSVVALLSSGRWGSARRVPRIDVVNIISRFPTPFVVWAIVVVVIVAPAGWLVAFNS
jgi:hypothetical protein